MTARHRVVIVGGGFGGLAAATALRREPVDVTIVDRQAHHLFQPLLYQVATGILSEGNVAPPIRDVLRRQDNAHVVLDDVVEIDLERKAVTCSLLDRTWDIGYDTWPRRRGSSSRARPEIGLRRGRPSIADQLVAVLDRSIRRRDADPGPRPDVVRISRREAPCSTPARR